MPGLGFRRRRTVELLRLWGRLALPLRLGPRRRLAPLFLTRVTCQTPVLPFHQRRHGFQLGPKIIDPRPMLQRQLLHALFELRLRRADLLLKEARPLL